MAMTYTTLSGAVTSAGSIKRWVSYSDIDVDTIIEEAQTLVFTTMRVREMRTFFTPLSMSIGDYYKALPTGFLDPISLKDITNGFELQMITDEQLAINRVYDSGVLVSSIPTEYAIFTDEAAGVEGFQFPYKYESAATLHLYGYKTPTLVSGSNASNFLTNRYPFLMRKACIALAANHMNNPEKYAQEKQELIELIGLVNSKDEENYRTV